MLCQAAGSCTCTVCSSAATSCARASACTSSTCCGERATNDSRRASPSTGGSNTDGYSMGCKQEPCAAHLPWSSHLLKLLGHAHICLLDGCESSPGFHCHLFHASTQLLPRLLDFFIPMRTGCCGHPGSSSASEHEWQLGTWGRSLKHPQHGAPWLSTLQCCGAMTLSGLGHIPRPGGRESIALSLPHCQLLTRPPAPTVPPVPLSPPAASSGAHGWCWRHPVLSSLLPPPVLQYPHACRDKGTWGGVTGTGLCVLASDRVRLCASLFLPRPTMSVCQEGPSTAVVPVVPNLPLCQHPRLRCPAAPVGGQQGDLLGNLLAMQTTAVRPRCHTHTDLLPQDSRCHREPAPWQPECRQRAGSPAVLTAARP